MLEVTSGMRRLLEKSPPPEMLRQFRKEHGETTLFDEGIIAADAGQTTLEEVLRGGGGLVGP